MLIYLAASSRELDRAERIMRTCEAAGFTITWNWIPGVRAAMERGITEAKADDARAEEAARADLDGVARADVLLFLAPTDTSKMAWSELGFAMALGIPCIVAHDSEERRNQSIVTRLAVRTSDAGIVNAVRSFGERGSLQRAMASVAWYAGQIATHAVKLDRAANEARRLALRDQIGADLGLLAKMAIDATHAFFDRRAA